MSYSDSSIRQVAFQPHFLFGWLHHVSYHISTNWELTFRPLFLFGWLHHVSYHSSTTWELTFLPLFLFGWLHHTSYHISTTRELTFLPLSLFGWLHHVSYLPIFPLLEKLNWPLEWLSCVLSVASISGTRHWNDNFQHAMQPSYLTELLFDMYPQHRLMITVTFPTHLSTAAA